MRLEAGNRYGRKVRMDFVAWPDYEMVRSNVVTGSMSVSHQPKLIKVHAVKRDDGGVASKTECGRLCSADPDQTEFQTWDAVHPYSKCQRCVDTAGGALITPTGQRVMPPRI
jgi:hypothetical protein